MSVTASVPLEQLPEPARIAWTGLRNELEAIFGEDLVAMWAYGGTVAIEGPPRPADLDTYVIVRRPIDEPTAEAIEGVQAIIGEHMGVEWDAWYVLEDDARRPESPRHAWREDRRDTSWAINRAHWLAGRYVLLYGREPAEIVAPPAWPELEVDLDRELEHLEAHVAEGDTDPYEATYAILNGSRIVRAARDRRCRDLQTCGRSLGPRASPGPMAPGPPCRGPRLRQPGIVGGYRSDRARDGSVRRDGPGAAAGRDARADDAPPRWSGS